MNAIAKPSADVLETKPPVIIPDRYLALRTLMPDSWAGPSGSSKDRWLVKAMNAARRNGLDVLQLQTVEVHDSWAFLDLSRVESALWARWGFSPDEAKPWIDAGFRDFEAYSFSTDGAEPWLVRLVWRLFASNNRPSSRRLRMYASSYAEYCELLPNASEEELRSMVARWGRWQSHKGVALEAAGYTHLEAQHAFDAGHTEVDEIARFVDAQRAYFRANAIIKTVELESDGLVTIDSSALPDGDWAIYFEAAEVAL